MAKRNYIDSGVSDNDLIKLAGQLTASELAVPEKTTWDWIQEDVEEWQENVKTRTAKFLEDLPEEFDLNKIEPQGRDAVAKWYKEMRQDYTAAANNAALFDPGSFAYTEGASKLNKIEDNMEAVNGIFENIKAVRTEAIKNKDNWASRVNEDQKGLMNALISGAAFDELEITKDGGIQFKIDGATYPDGQDYFTEDDIKSLPIKSFKSESALNGITATVQGFKVDGVAYKGKEATIKKSIVDALNIGRETGENMDLMFDVAGLDDSKSYITTWLENNTNHDVYKDVKSIRQNIQAFYNEHEQDFIDNFLMPRTKKVYDDADIGEEARDALLKRKAEIDKIKSQTAVNYASINKNEKSKVNLTEQAEQVNNILANNPENATFKYGGFTVDKKGGSYSINDGKTTKIVNSEEEMMNLINFNDGGSGNDRRELKKLKDQVPVVPRPITASTAGVTDSALKQLNTLYGMYKVKFSEEGNNLKIVGPDKKVILVEMNRYGDENNNESRKMIRDFVLNYVKLTEDE